MQEFMGLVIAGLATGAIYSVMASCLVLSFETSGIFNFAQPAIAFCCAYFYYELNTGWSVPIVPAAILTVVVFAPLLGLALNRLIFAPLATAPVYVRVVGTIGVLIALPNFALWLVSAVMGDTFGLNVIDLSKGGDNAGFGVPGIGPTPPKVFSLSWIGLGSVHLNSDQVAVFVLAAMAALVLYIVIRRTRVGLQMRAQVDRAPLAALRGIDPSRTSGIAWMLSVTLAGLAGVLIAPLFHLDNSTFVIVVFASLCAVAIAGMRSIPLAFAVGLGLGVLQNLVRGYKTDLFPDFLSKLTGLDAAIPYVLLIVALLVVGTRRGRVAGSIADERPPPDHRASLPSWRRKLPWAIVGVLLVLYAVGALPWPQNAPYVRSSILAPGLALAIVFLSFVVVTGIGGMASLAQATFVTAGGFAAGWALQTADATHPPPWAKWHFDIPLVLHNGHLNFLVACLLGALVAGIVGALIALTVRRLGPLELALATFALAWVVFFLAFQNDNLSNSSIGYNFLPPTFNFFGIHTFDFSSSSQLVCLLLGIFGLLALLVHNLKNSATGRAMYATRSSAVAAHASGISTARAQVALFALSAMIAGFGGALYGVTTISITRDTAPPLIGILWLAVAVTFGVRRPGGALLAGLAFAAGAEIWHQLSTWSFVPDAVSTLTTSPFFLPMLFGLGAIGLARNPDGVLSAFGQRRMEKARKKERKAEAARVRVTEPSPIDVASAASVPTNGFGAAAAITRDTPSAAPSDDAALLLENLVAGYGDAEVLHGLTIGVRPGEIVAVLGRNGAGKSTLCGVAAGAVALTSGRVVLAGDDISAVPAFARARRGLTLVPEARGVFPGLTVEENLRVMLDDHELRDRAYDRFAVLRERRGQIAGLLSGGEQQMLSLAPALAAPPRVLIADEPTLGLAPLVAEVVLDALSDLRAAGTAILLAEEKASEVMKLADVVTVVELGRIAWTRRCDAVTEEELAAVYLTGAPTATNGARHEEGVLASEGQREDDLAERGAEQTS
jgi:ABC-type branched-subunit amino acid transport system ATPase component/branched-subunit amino acid ABC-type transport system permease component